MPYDTFDFSNWEIIDFPNTPHSMDYTMQRMRAADGSLITQMYSTRPYWSMANIKVRFREAQNLSDFLRFYDAHQDTPFLFYDPSVNMGRVYLERILQPSTSTTVYPLRNTYIVSGSISVYKDGVFTTDYTIDTTTGRITFTSPLSSAVVVTATYQFQRLCLFDGGYQLQPRAWTAGFDNTKYNGIATFSLIEQRI